MSLKKIIFLSTVIFLIGHIVSFAQSTKVSLSGTVVDAKSGETLPFVVVNIKELNLWTTSNINGKFSFKEVKKGGYTLQASCLGFKDYEMKIKMDKNVEKYALKMDEESLALKEVTVTATTGNKMNSSSFINKTALTHLQASSISDVMQLLPGSLTLNPNLTSINKLTIRDISGTDATNSLGTAVIVDGASLSNDANLQMTSTASSYSAINTSSGTGIDARKIPVENIESIEIIRGVASAEYGDMTSGAIIVKTKAGKSPFELRLKTYPKSKEVSASEGFALGSGFLNASADYLYASSDTRSPAKSYNRLTFQLGYSNVFNKDKSPLSFNTKLNGYLTLDKTKKDPDAVSTEELSKAEEQEISLNVYGNWMLNKSWITSIKYNVAGSYGKQYNREKMLRRPGHVPYSNTLESGEYQVDFLPKDDFYSNLEITGKPVYLQAQVTANVAGKYGSVYNKFMIGAEFNSKGNVGDGKTFDPTLPPALNLRPRPFKDIPFINQISAFTEDNVTFTFGKQALDLSAGIRMTNIDTKAANYDIIVDPRFNARLKIIDDPWNRKGMQRLNLRAGWGILHKMPTLVHLYPDPSYADKIGCSYTDGDITSFAIMSSLVSETSNPNLKLPKSTNMEVGMDIKFLGVNGSISYFNEKLRNGFNFGSTAVPYYYSEYAIPNQAGLKPEYSNGQIIINGNPVASKQDSLFVSYTRPGNGNSTDKWGIEYSFDFGHIDIIKTSILMDGAYFHVKRLENDLQIKSMGDSYKYAAIYAGTGDAHNGSIAQRLNTNVRFVTHIPQLRFIMTLGAQCVWMDKSRRIAEYGGQNRVYMTDKDGNIVEGDPTKDKEYTKCVNPIAYMDLKGNIHSFTAADAQNSDMKRMIISSNTKALFNESSIDPYFMLNLRLTKEIGKITTFSFYANNFTNSRPRRKDSSTEMYTKLNTDIYFGAELSFKF